jgi:SOS-response transcriptional repressor LexA
MASADLIEQGRQRRAEILACIASFHGKHGYAPSIAQIAAAVQLSSHSAVRHHLGLLKTQGKVTWEAGGHRSLRLVGTELS